MDAGSEHWLISYQLVEDGAELLSFRILSFIINKMEIIYEISLIDQLQELNKIICRKCLDNCGHL